MAALGGDFQTTAVVFDDLCNTTSSAIIYLGVLEDRDFDAAACMAWGVAEQRSENIARLLERLGLATQPRRWRPLRNDRPRHNATYRNMPQRAAYRHCEYHATARHCFRTAGWLKSTKR